MALADRIRLGRESVRAILSVPRASDVAACLVSFVVHFTAFIGLAFVTLLVPVDDRLSLSVSALNFDDEIIPQEFHFSPEPSSQIGALSDGGLAEARPVALSEAPETQLTYDLEPATTIGEIRVFEFDRTLLESPNVTENLMVKGAGSVGTSGAAGAVDRITHEILLSLDQRPTLVVWLFDQSGSLKAQREAIAKRFDRVYEELGLIESSGNKSFKQHKVEPLLTAVASFGEGVQLITPKPTADLDDIKASVRAVSDDDSGTENVFQSIGYLADKFRHHRLAKPRRNVMIVVFTDEAGDDIGQLDATVATCRKFEMPVYVVGVPAPFGRTEAYIKYVDPDPNYDQTPQYVPVHQGPESLLPERIKLLFGGREEQEEVMDSGFGPFGLCRLAYETGGIYFTVHPNREVGRRIASWETAAMTSHMSSFFDPRVMRNYRPDYVTAAEYRELITSNRAIAALIEAAQLSATTPLENVRRRFPKIDEGQFARDLSLAQRDAAKLEPKVNRLVEILQQGEPDRENVNRPRWQAGYDLAIGRALAVKVRAEGYNAMLAEAKQGMKFKDERSDTWELESSDSITSSSALAKDATDARKYLQRVIEEHEGTPWSIEAKRELREPMGWKWRETFTDVAGRMARASNGRPRPNPTAPKPKPRRDPPKL